MAYTPPANSIPAAPIKARLRAPELSDEVSVTEFDSVAMTIGSIATMVALVGASVGGTAEGARVTCATAAGVATLDVGAVDNVARTGVTVGGALVEVAVA